MATFIIAEAGSNWWADDELGFARACELISVAAKAGADACKFQAFTPGKVYAPGAGGFGEFGDVNQLFDKLAMPREWIPKLAAVCEENHIEFMASVFSVEDLEAVDPHVKRHKIASYELGHEELIRAAIKTGKPVIISTGAATQDEIDTVESWFDRMPERLTLLECTAAYPASPEQTYMGRLWSGVSDHTTDPLIVPVAAVAQGAHIIEKHFTLARNAVGPDHAFALEPHELRHMVRVIRIIEHAIDDSARSVLPVEEPLRRFAVRCVMSTRPIEPNERLSAKNSAVLRPGNLPRGEHALAYYSMLGRRVKHAIPANHGVLLTDMDE